MPMSRLLGGTRLMSRPCSRISPLSAVSKPASSIRSVVLPEPDGPSSDTNSPASTSSETESVAVTLP